MVQKHHSELIGTTIIWLPFISMKWRTRNEEDKRNNTKLIFIELFSIVPRSQCSASDKQMNSLCAHSCSFVTHFESSNFILWLNISVCNVLCGCFWYRIRIPLYELVQRNLFCQCLMLALQYGLASMISRSICIQSTYKICRRNLFYQIACNTE